MSSGSDRSRSSREVTTDKKAKKGKRNQSEGAGISDEQMSRLLGAIEGKAKETNAKIDHVSGQVAGLSTDLNTLKMETGKKFKEVDDKFDEHMKMIKELQDKKPEMAQNPYSGSSSDFVPH